MVSVASQFVEDVTAHAQSNSLEDARAICADGTYFPNDLRNKSSFVEKIYETWFGFDIGHVLYYVDKTYN